MLGSENKVERLSNTLSASKGTNNSPFRIS